MPLGCGSVQGLEVRTGVVCRGVAWSWILEELYGVGGDRRLPFVGTVFLDSRAQTYFCSFVRVWELVTVRRRWVKSYGLMTLSPFDGQPSRVFAH